MTTREDEKQMYRDLIEGCNKDYADMIAKYGTGVRPSWVSEELSWIGRRTQSYRATLARLEAEDNERGFDEYGNYGENNPPVGGRNA
jgi:hypothetical protein